MTMQMTIQDQLMLDQIAEGKRRKKLEGEWGIFLVRRMKCQYVDYISEGRQEAVIVGAYLNHKWSPYVYSAYHIIRPDGSKTTIPSKSVIRTRLLE